MASKLNSGVGWIDKLANDHFANSTREERRRLLEEVTACTSPETIAMWEGDDSEFSTSPDEGPMPEQQSQTVCLCCHIAAGRPPEECCKAPAEWEIIHGPSPDDYTFACTKHVGDLLTDAAEHRVYRYGAKRLGR